MKLFLMLALTTLSISAFANPSADSKNCRDQAKTDNKQIQACAQNELEASMKNLELLMADFNQKNSKLAPIFHAPNPNKKPHSFVIVPTPQHSSLGMQNSPDCSHILYDLTGESIQGKSPAPNRRDHYENDGARKQEVNKPPVARSKSGNVRK